MDGMIANRELACRQASFITAQMGQSDGADEEQR